MPAPLQRPAAEALAVSPEAFRWDARLSPTPGEAKPFLSLRTLESSRSAPLFTLFDEPDSVSSLASAPSSSSSPLLAPPRPTLRSRSSSSGAEEQSSSSSSTPSLVRSLLFESDSGASLEASTGSLQKEPLATSQSLATMSAAGSRRKDGSIKQLCSRLLLRRRPSALVSPSLASDGASSATLESPMVLTPKDDLSLLGPPSLLDAVKIDEAPLAPTVSRSEPSAITQLTCPQDVQAPQMKDPPIKDGDLLLDSDLLRAVLESSFDEDIPTPLVQPQQQHEPTRRTHDWLDAPAPPLPSQPRPLPGRVLSQAEANAAILSRSRRGDADESSEDEYGEEVEEEPVVSTAAEALSAFPSSLRPKAPSPVPTTAARPTGIDSPAKRALYNCTLLKLHPSAQLAAAIRAANPQETEALAGHKGEEEIQVPRSLNPAAKLASHSSTHSLSRSLGTTLAHAQTLRRLKREGITREQEVELGWFQRRYGSRAVSPGSMPAVAAPKPEALLAPSMAAGGLRRWASRPPYAQRCGVQHAEGHNEPIVVAIPSPLVFSQRIQALAEMGAGHGRGASEQSGGTSAESFTTAPGTPASASSSLPAEKLPKSPVQSPAAKVPQSHVIKSSPWLGPRTPRQARKERAAIADSSDDSEEELPLALIRQHAKQRIGTPPQVARTPKVHTPSPARRAAEEAQKVAAERESRRRAYEDRQLLRNRAELQQIRERKRISVQQTHRTEQTYGAGDPTRTTPSSRTSPRAVPRSSTMPAMLHTQSFVPPPWAAHPSMHQPSPAMLLPPFAHMPQRRMIPHQSP